MYAAVNAMKILQTLAGGVAAVRKWKRSALGPSSGELHPCSCVHQLSQSPHKQSPFAGCLLSQGALGQHFARVVRPHAVELHGQDVEIDVSRKRPCAAGRSKLESMSYT